jgi:hypothetical protein
MSLVKLSPIALMVAIAAGNVDAAPQLIVEPGELNDGNRQWFISVVPDNTLFRGSPLTTSITAYLQFEVQSPANAHVDLLGVVANSSKWSGVSFSSPFDGMPASGIATDSIKDRFAAYFDSAVLSSADPVPLLTITTSGAGPTTLVFGDQPGDHTLSPTWLMQANLQFAVSGAVSVVPEPESIIAMLFGVACIFCGQVRFSRL